MWDMTFGVVDRGVDRRKGTCGIRPNTHTGSLLSLDSYRLIAGFEVYKRRNLVCNDLAKITNEKHTDEESTQAKGTVTVKEQRSECLTRAPELY